MNLRNLLLACALGSATATAAIIPAAAQVYVQTAPPAPIYESVPAAPGAGYYWVAGYWEWNGYRYVWRRGYYAETPYSGAAWVPGHWVHNGYGWYWRAGHWRRPY